MTLTRGQRVIAFVEKYCRVPEGDLVGQPMRLEAFQKKFILEVYDNPAGTRLAILSIGKKNGKGLAIDTPIPTPRGWTTMGALREGDQVFDETGAPCTVTYESPTHIGLRCWRLAFSDGTSVVADENHRWITTHRPWRGKHKFARPETSMVTTPEIAESVDLGNGQHNHAIAVAGALQTEESVLPIDPYLLGCWLGDGDSDCARLTCGAQDVEHFRMAVGDAIRAQPSVAQGRPGCFRVLLSAGRGGARASKVQTVLRRLGLLENKHVPNDYLWAGTEQRRSLLQGLMDTDGTATRTGRSGAVSCCFTNCNQAIAFGVLHLVRSLGMKASIRSRPAKVDGRAVGTSWEVQFTAYADDAPFRLPRKLSRLRLRPAKPTRASSVRIVSCEPVESVPTKCIVVDSPSHQFLCGDGLTATHNTPLIAALLLAHIAGPEARQNSQIVSGAMSQKQAATVFKYAWKMVQFSDALAKLVRVKPSTKTLIGLARNVEYQAISRQKKTAHGIAPVLALLDELGQVRGPQDDFVEAVTTAMGAYDDAMLFVISTQAASDADMLSVWIDDQKETRDPQTVCHVYAAEDPDCDVMDETAWRQANPALGKFRSQKDLRSNAEKASRMPSYEASFRNLMLNQRVETSNPLITRGVWIANSFEPDPTAFYEGPVWCGLDLSMRTDLTAFVMIAMKDSRWHVKVTFWAPEKGLRERAKRDRQPYDVWAKQGLIRLTPGAAVDYDEVARDIRELLEGCDVRALGYDRWRIDVIKAAFERIGYAVPVEEFGQGYKDMSPAVDALEAELLNDRISHGNHPVLTMCAANVKASKDEAGNRKPNRIHSTGRIDGIAALLTALGVAHRQLEVEKPKTYQSFFVG